MALQGWTSEMEGCSFTGRSGGTSEGERKDREINEDKDHLIMRLHSTITVFNN